MLRKLYIQLLWMHPRRFRRRFGDEMLWIFDEAAQDQPRLILDGVVSLFRQWALRPQFRTEPASAATSAADGVPMFWVAEDEKLPPGSLLRGGIATILVFALVGFTFSRGARRGTFLMGSHHAAVSHMLKASTTAEPPDLNTEVRMKPEPDPVKFPGALEYFRVIRVLSAIDTDHDGQLSLPEIARSSEALQRLDRDHDGKLSPEECGFVFDGDLLALKLDASFAEKARHDFMSYHPALAILDADSNSEISASEIKNAPAALRRLDYNHDGSLTIDELLPVENLLILIMRLDRDGDGSISPSERANAYGDHFRDLLNHAGTNPDGSITADQLRRAILKRR